VRVQRTSLVAYRSSVVTPDVAEAMRQLEISAADRGGIRISYKGTPRTDLHWEADTGPTECPPHLSMRPTGREVLLRVEFDSYEGPPELRREAEIAALWGLAIPHRFMPWKRHPTPGAGDDVFHFLGPWNTLHDHLLSDGRGEIAWASVCAAAQVDVGSWQGTKEVERFVQAQLHRIGFPCGPVDGEIGERTVSAIRSLGMQGKSLMETAQALAKMRDPKRHGSGRRIGHLVLAGDDVSVSAYGEIAAAKTRHGASVTVDGPGRLVVVVGEEA
jgi:hypothetical protein